MRLKGGKVLLDLTAYDISSDVELPLEDNQIKAIFEKGLSILVNIGGVNHILI